MIDAGPAAAVLDVAVREATGGLGVTTVIDHVAGDMIAATVPALADGRIHAVVDSVHPFSEAGAALERLRSGKAEGKIVLRLP